MLSSAKSLGPTPWWLWKGLIALLAFHCFSAASGCSGAQVCSYSYSPYANLVGVYAMVPENCMSGQLWDWEPATKAEWNEFLGSLLPSRDNVGEDELGVDVFEKHCGKRVLWIPKRPDAIEDSFRDTYRNMLERMSGGPGLGECGQMTNAKYLSGLLQVVAPERDRGAALEFLRGGAEYRDYIYVAVLTKKWLLMIRVPRDQVRPSIIVPACPGTP